ncbi:hypothetical protein SAMN05216233_10521 [Desulfoluna spongiiphila]|uniref:Uncharacterized protein n=1 Tax=Desulfoluna spongiiphila TaxID=419481 RepID=A0A1G5DVA9_9BACT|nr:hypothetical protein SAMN05216233_10521 [Desulfoluna spongiiphila]
MNRNLVILSNKHSALRDALEKNNSVSGEFVKTPPPGRLRSTATTFCSSIPSLSVNPK